MMCEAPDPALQNKVIFFQKKHEDLLSNIQDC